MKSTQRPSDESKGRNLLVDMAKECGVSLEEIVIQITNDESLSPIDYTEKPLSIDLAPSNGNGTKRRILTAKRQLPKKSQSDFIFTATQITKKKTKVILTAQIINFVSVFFLYVSVKWKCQLTSDHYTLHELVEFKVQYLKVFCYHGNKSTILRFYLIFRTTPEVSIVNFTLLK